MPSTTYPSSVSRTLNDKLGESPSAIDFSAVGDGVYLDDASISSGDATLTSASASFTTTDIGKWICVMGAGSTGDALVTSIASINSGTSVELTASASASVSGAECYYGTDDSAALQAAINSVLEGSTLKLGLLGRIFICGSALTVDKRIDIAIEGSTIVCGGSDAGISITSSDVSVRGCGFSRIRSVRQAANTIDIAGSVERVSICGPGLAIQAGGKTIDEPNRQLGNCILANGGDGAVSDIIIRECELSDGHNGVLFEFTTHSKVDGCQFRWTHAALACVSLRSSDHCAVTNNSFTDSGESANALYLLHAQDLPCKYNTITGNRISGSFSFEAINVFGSYNTVNANTIYLTRTSGYNVGISFAQPGDADTSSATHDNIANGNIITLSTVGGYPGINCIDNGSGGNYGSNDNVITNNQLQGCGITINDFCSRNKIAGNNIDAENKASTDCISLQGVNIRGTSIFDNTLRRGGRKGVFNNGAKDTQVRGNVITGATETGVETGGTSDRIAICDNHIYSNNFGIYFSFDPTSPRVSGNKVHDNTSGDYGLGSASADTSERDSTGKMLINKVVEQDSNLKLDVGGSDVGIDNNKGLRMRKSSGDLGDAILYRDTGDRVVVRNAESGGGISVRSGGDFDRIRLPGPAYSSTTTDPTELASIEANPMEFLLPIKLLRRILFNNTNISINPIAGDDFLDFKSNSDGTGDLILRLDRNTLRLTVTGAFVAEGGAAIRGGAGSPEGSVGEALGSLYLSTSGVIYWKAVDTGSTGWQPLSLPDQTGNAGKSLKTNGTSASWGKVLLGDATNVDTTGLTNGALVKVHASGGRLDTAAISGTGFAHTTSGVLDSTAKKVDLQSSSDVMGSTLNVGNVAVIASGQVIGDISNSSLASQLVSSMASALLADSGFMSGIAGDSGIMAAALAYVIANATISTSVTINDPSHGHNVSGSIANSGPTGISATATSTLS